MLYLTKSNPLRINHNSILKTSCLVLLLVILSGCKDEIVDTDEVPSKLVLLKGSIGLDRVLSSQAISRVSSGSVQSIHRIEIYDKNQSLLGSFEPKSSVDRFMILGDFREKDLYFKAMGTNHNFEFRLGYFNSAKNYFNLGILTPEDDELADHAIKSIQLEGYSKLDIQSLKKARDIIKGNLFKDPRVREYFSSMEDDHGNHLRTMLTNWRQRYPGQKFSIKNLNLSSLTADEILHLKSFSELSLDEQNTIIDKVSITTNGAE